MRITIIELEKKNIKTYRESTHKEKKELKITNTKNDTVNLTKTEFLCKPQFEGK